MLGLAWTATGGYLSDVKWAPAEAWAVGFSLATYDGLALHWDGQRWSRGPVNGQESTLFTMVAPASSASALAVGSGGALLRWDGRSWTPIPLMVRLPAFLTDVGMVDAQLGWAVGRAGKILRWDGRDWVEQTPFENSIYSIHVNDAGLTFLSGAYTLGSGDNSGDWDLQAVPEFMVSVDSVAATKTAYAAGQTAEAESHGVIYRKRPGEGWAPMTVPQPPRLEGIRMFDDSYGIAVGAKGTILRWHEQGDAWLAAPAPPARTSPPLPCAPPMTCGRWACAEPWCTLTATAGRLRAGRHLVRRLRRLYVPL